MTETQTERCREWSRSAGFSGGRCNRPVKYGGTMCGIHAAAKRKTEQNRERRERAWEERDRQRELDAVLTAKCSQLMAAIPYALEAGSLDTLRKAWEEYETAKKACGKR